MTNRVFLVVLLTSLSLLLGAQTSENLDLEQFIEEYFEFQDEGINYEELYESLLLLYTSPLNLNMASLEDLQSLYVLSPSQAKEITDYRTRNGPFISIYELQAVPNLDISTIRKIMPFVTIREVKDGRSLLARVMSGSNKYFILRTRRILEEQRGFTESDFAGDRNLLYGRLRLSQKGDYSFGVTFEKDPGEQLSFDRYAGFDFYSTHVMLENRGLLKRVVVGDFQGQWGQGLVYGAGFGVGKGAETINTVRRSSTGLKPYTSVLESNFFRGGATTIGLGKINATVLYSNLYQDANIQSDSVFNEETNQLANLEEFITSIQVTGFHRTESEIARRNQLKEQNIGGVISYDVVRNLSVGFTSLHTSFSSPIQRIPNSYNQFEFRGRNNLLNSLYFTSTWENFSFFGEAARSSSGGNAAIAGFISSLSKVVDLSFVYRNYARDFHTFYGNGFGEGSRIINEIGTYWGLKIKPARRHVLTLYYDRFRFPWLRFRAEAPSEGMEYLARWTYKPMRSVVMFVHFRQENKDRTFQPEGSNLNVLQTGKRRNFIFNVDYKVNSYLSLKTRVQGSDFRLSNQRSKGFVVLQDINFTFWKVKLSGRMAIFTAEDADNRQYLYEKNALYLFSILGLSDTGTRRYLLMQYDVNRKISLWVRYAQSTFQQGSIIGAGLNAIEGNSRSELTIQTRIKL